MCKLFDDNYVCANCHLSCALVKVSLCDVWGQGLYYVHICNKFLFFVFFIIRFFFFFFFFFNYLVSGFNIFLMHASLSF